MVDNIVALQLKIHPRNRTAFREHVLRLFSEYCTAGTNAAKRNEINEENKKTNKNVILTAAGSMTTAACAVGAQLRQMSF